MRTATAAAPPAAAEASEAPAAALAPGMRLGAYELLAPVASGGMGHVWSAVRIGDFGFRRTVAVKVMREELAGDPSFRRMFLDEARLASGLSHSNVVEVLDLGEGAGRLYLAMALIEGDSLAHLVFTAKKRGAEGMPPDVVARVIADVLRGLHAAHELRGKDGEPLGLVHRDVSPQNVLVGVDGVAKLTDFGVVKARGEVARSSRSERKGKLAYMAPEQLAGRALDRRCDVFAAGVVLWELLVGARMPRRAPEDARGEREDDACEYVHPATIRADVSRALSDVAMKALAHDPDERFATAEAMADAVERAAHAEGWRLSPKRVAEWVHPLVAADVERRRHDTEAQLARSRAGTLVETSIDGESSAAVGSRKRARSTLAVLAVSIAAGLFAARAASRQGSRLASAEEAATPAPLVAAPAPSAPSAPTTPSTSTAVSVASELAPAAAAPLAAPPGIASASNKPTSATPKPRRSDAARAPTPRLLYGNPYGGGAR